MFFEALRIFHPSWNCTFVSKIGIETLSTQFLTDEELLESALITVMWHMAPAGATTLVH